MPSSWPPVLGLGLTFKSTFCYVCMPLTLTIKEQKCLEGSGELTPHFGDNFCPLWAHFSAAIHYFKNSHVQNTQPLEGNV